MDGTLKEPPSQAADAEWELWNHEAQPAHISNLASGSWVVMGSQELMMEDDPYTSFDEVYHGPDLLEDDAMPYATASMALDDGPSSGQGLPSSEGDYFYTDGQGNVYAIEKPSAPGTEVAEWPSTPQFVDSEGLCYEEEEEEEETHGDGDANEAYIMYHEMQHWQPLSDVLVHAANTTNEAPPLPFFDGTPFDN
ncbi:hypothetical protein N0V88_000296 [Collariella sp. IMI 366227]|nr:hypothetical protein N0V88_000296 [Collariella sp. IMI 366227]